MKIWSRQEFVDEQNLYLLVTVELEFAQTSLNTTKYMVSYLKIPQLKQWLILPNIGCLEQSKNEYLQLYHLEVTLFPRIDLFKII